MTEISISKVYIKIGKREIKLSVDEAKKLQKILNETFEEKETVQSYPIYQPPYRITYGSTFGTGTITTMTTNCISD